MTPRYVGASCVFLISCEVLATCNAISQHSLFISGHTRSSIHIILRITDHSFQYASPHLWNQLPASLCQPRTNLDFCITQFCEWHFLPVPSTHHFHHPLPLHSSTPGLKLSFSANPSHRSLPFLLPERLHGFPGLFTDTSEHIRFLLCSLPVLHCCCSVL